MSVLLQVCVSTPDDVFVAAEAGADRVELSRKLSSGGLTPSVAAVRWVSSGLSIPLVVTICPRTGGFVYSRIEIQDMAKDVAAMVAAGAKGIVTGALTAGSLLDVLAMKEFLSGGVGCGGRLSPCVRFGRKQVHRAGKADRARRQPGPDFRWGENRSSGRRRDRATRPAIARAHRHPPRRRDQTSRHSRADQSYGMHTDPWLVLESRPRRGACGRPRTGAAGENQHRVHLAAGSEHGAAVASAPSSSRR